MESLWPWHRLNGHGIAPHRHVDHERQVDQRYEQQRKRTKRRSVGNFKTAATVSFGNDCRTSPSRNDNGPDGPAVGSASMNPVNRTKSYDGEAQRSIATIATRALLASALLIATMSIAGAATVAADNCDTTQIPDGVPASVERNVHALNDRHGVDGPAIPSGVSPAVERNVRALYQESGCA